MEPKNYDYEEEEFIDDREEEDWEDYYERQKEAEYEEKAEYAANCRCGAWVFAKNGNHIHVADCCCGAE